MANEIYHKSNWGNPEKDGWGDVYFNPSATNRLYTRSDNYENVEGTDKALASKPDTQSVLMTPTAYNVGSMNSILPPYEVLPTEFVTNGGFDTDSGWTVQSGWAIANGVATCSSGNNYVYQTAGIPANTKVTVTLEITNYTSGSIRIGSTGYGGAEFVSGLGNYSVTYTTWYNTGGVEIKSSSFVGSIDNVSVKEVRNADFTFDRNSTATRVNKEGLIETVAIDTPRLDYPFIDGVVQSEPSLLLEPSSTNVVRYSQDFSQSSWNINDVSIESGYLAPDGTNSAYKITKTGSNAHLVDTSSGGNTATKSIYAKTTSGTGTILLFNNVSTYFTITEEWQRFDAQQDGLDFFYAADFRKVSTLTEIIIWGAQSEALTYPTSYIPTSGSAVTRVADACTGAGNEQVINSTEGVLYFEGIATNPDISAHSQISISSATNSGNNRVMITPSSDTLLSLRFNAGGTQLVTQAVTVSSLSVNSKIAVRWGNGNYSLYQNGSEVYTQAIASTPTGLAKLNFSSVTETNNFNGKCKDLRVYNTALTDSELEALTSWDSFSDMATGQLYSIR